MDYLEKAKYELILGIKNEESSDVINVLNQYYNDMVKLLLNSNNVIKQPLPRYVLHVHSNDKRINNFFFTSEKKMNEFFENIKDTDSTISFSLIGNIDPEDKFHSCENSVLN